MEKKPFLSVIMPIYNAEEYLEDAINSILDQTFTDYELILVDDKSKDESLKICQRYVVQDSRVKVIALEQNGGAGNARNIGMQNLQGKYVTFIDADDFIDSFLFEHAYQMAEKSNLDMIVWGITEEYFDKYGECYSKNILNLPEKIYKNREEIKEAVISLEEKTMFGYQWNKFYKAEIMKEYDVQFEKVVLYEDYFMNLEFVKRVNSIGIIADVGYHYMKRDNDSITTRFVPEYFELSRRRIESMFQLYQQWNADDKKVRDILGERYLRYILAALAKSFDKRSGSNFRARKKWLSEIRMDSLYIELVESCAIKQKIMKIFSTLMNNKMWTFSIIFGNVVWIGKEKMPVVFNKIRRFR